MRSRRRRARAPRLGAATLLHQGRHAERWLPAAAIERAVRLCAPGRRRAADAAVDRAGRGVGALPSGRRGPRSAHRRPGRARPGPSSGAPGVRAFDPLRLTRRPARDGRDARAVAAALRERAAIGPSSRPSAAVLGAGDRRLGCRALRRGAAGARSGPSRRDRPGRLAPAPRGPSPPMCTPRARLARAAGAVPARRRVGRVASRTLTPYPPASPRAARRALVIEVVAKLRAIAAGGRRVHGSPDGLATFGGRSPARATGGSPRAHPGERRHRGGRRCPHGRVVGATERRGRRPEQPQRARAAAPDAHRHEVGRDAPRSGRSRP